MYKIKFGTDGWRGVIARDFTFDNVRIISQAIADYIKQNSSGKSFNMVIGYDMRFLSEKYAEIVARVMEGNGISVLFSSQPVTTPTVSHAVVKHKANAGIMVTASHNPPFYNGIKVKASFGGSISSGTGKQIEKFLYKNSPRIKEGNSKITNFYTDYIKDLQSYIDLKLIKKSRLKIVFDSMYGSGCSYLEDVLKSTNCKIIAIHSQRKAMFGGLNPEPIEKNLEELKKKVIEEKADIGIAVDGDGDRVGVVDDKGKYLSPHQVFPLILSYLIESKQWSGKVVQAISLGYLGERIARHYHLPFQEVHVGFKNVCELMLKENILMGGEESGGYGYQGYLPERDGVLSGLWIVEMLAKRKKKLSQVVLEMQKRFGRSVFERKDVQITKIKKLLSSKQGAKKNKTELGKKLFTDLVTQKIPNKLIGIPVKQVKTFDGVKIILDNDAWLLLRPSGTEPVVRLYSEAESKRKVDLLLDEGRKIINKISS